MKPRGTICMLVRTSVRRDPRVTKQAATLVRAGWRVRVVAAGLPDEAARLERHALGFVIMRTRLGWMRRRRFARAVTASDTAATNGSGVPVPAPPRPLTRYRVARLLLARVAILLRMLPLIRRSRPDVILAHNVNTLLAGWVGARLTGAPLVYDAHEVNLNREGYYTQLRPVVRAVERFVIPQCARMTTTTALRARHFRRAYRLSTTPAVFENRPPYVAVEKTEKLRATLGIAPERLIVLYQGGLQEGRGLHHMVRAMAGVDGADLVFLGDGPQRGSLAALARSLGTGSHVHFAGYVPLTELPAWTASADIGLQLLRNTSFNHYSTDSNKLFEYAIAGLPVVASDFPEIRRIVRRYGFGFLVDPEDVDEIRAAVQRLVTCAAVRQRLAAAARSAAHALSWDAVESDYLEMIDQIRNQR